METIVNWTDDRVEKLKRLWAEGLSASQIAGQLGGVSRNAVIGKVHRLNLPGRAKSGGATAARSQKRVAAPAQTRPQAFVPRAMPRTVARTSGTALVKDELDVDTLEIVETTSNNVVVPIFRRVSLIRLTERTCKWPLGDPLKDDFCFCGNDAPENSPYCTFHQKLAYQPSADRRRAR